MNHSNRSPSLHCRRFYGFFLALLFGSACTYHVDSFVDAPDADPGDFLCETAAGECTLRAAIEEANSLPTADLIVLSPGTYTLDLPVAAGGGQLNITESVTIQGAGRTATVIEQEEFSQRVMSVSGGEVDIANLTLRGASAPFLDGGGLLVLDGTVEVADVGLIGNEAFRGAGIAVRVAADVRMLRVAIRDNSAAERGGGVYNFGTLAITNSEVSGNDSNRVGGIANQGDLRLTNVTVSGNIARSGSAGTGGLSQVGSAVLRNVTVTENSSFSGPASSFRAGGIHLVPGSSTTITNSIIANNDGGPGGPDDCDGELGVGSARNLIGHSQGCNITAHLPSYILDVDAQLGPLALNGGQTLNHAPLPASPAIDSGGPPPPAVLFPCARFDQREVPRPAGAGPCDRGAVEVSPTSPTPNFQGFRLVDATTDLDIRLLLHGDVLALSELPGELSIRAEVLSASSVVFDFNGVEAFQIENIPPYGLSPNPGGDFAPLPLPPGEYTLRATPYDGPDGTGNPGPGRSIRFRVFEGTGLVEVDAANVVAPIETPGVLDRSLEVDPRRLETIEIGEQGRLRVFEELSSSSAARGPQELARAFSEQTPLCDERSCVCLDAASCNRLFMSTCANPARPAACATGDTFACICEP